MAKKRFVEVRNAGVLDQQRVCVDTMTGVNHLLLTYAANNRGSGLTVLYGADGKPLVTPPAELARLVDEDG